MIAKNSLSFMLCVERIQTRDCRQERSRDQISLISTPCLQWAGPGYCRLWEHCCRLWPHEDILQSQLYVFIHRYPDTDNIQTT